MRSPLSKPWIIGVLFVGLAVLSACTALRLGYSQAPTILYWRLDSYADFDDHQTPRVRNAIAEWFRWHRGSQLPGYVRLLAQAGADTQQPTTPQALCQWVDTLQVLGQPMFDQAVPAMVQLAHTLTPAQVRHIERKYAKVNDEFRKDFLQDDAEDRLDASVKRAVDRAEMVYKRLTKAQREQVRQALRTSPADPAVWFTERQRRQQEVLQALRRILAHQASPSDTEAAFRAAYAHLLRSPNAAYREHKERLDAYNCRWVAELHNSTSPEQRRAAASTLKGWEDDVRALAAAATESGE